jgi:hypothetical protein
MMAATDIMTIAITIGIASGSFAPGNVRNAGKNPNNTTSATPTSRRFRLLKIVDPLAILHGVDDAQRQ